MECDCGILFSSYGFHNSFRAHQTPSPIDPVRQPDRAPPIEPNQPKPITPPQPDPNPIPERDLPPYNPPVEPPVIPPQPGTPKPGISLLH